MIETMVQDLLSHQRYQTLSIGYIVASWLLRGEDLEWLKKEYQKMYELFEDAPAWQWMEETILERERKKTEQRVQEERRKAEEDLKKAEQRVQELKKVEQKMLEERRKAEEERRKAEEEHKKLVATLRQTVVALVAQRFPTLERLAKAQVHVLDQMERFPQVLLRLSLARDVDEAQEVLLSLHEDEDTEHE